MELSFELSPDESEKLQAEAERLGLKPDELAKAVVAHISSTPKDEFIRALEVVVQRNEHLYRRLS